MVVKSFKLLHIWSANCELYLLQKKNGKQGATSRCLKICFLHFSSIYFSTYFKETKFIARKVDI